TMGSSTILDRHPGVLARPLRPGEPRRATAPIRPTKITGRLSFEARTQPSGCMLAPQDDGLRFRGVKAALLALATAATIITFEPARALTPEEALNYRGPDREQKLIEGARQEGQVVLYSALIVNQMLRPLAAGFMKKYPFLKMSYYRADSEEILQKLSAEMRS